MFQKVNSRGAQVCCGQAYSHLTSSTLRCLRFQGDLDSFLVIAMQCLALQRTCGWRPNRALLGQLCCFIYGTDSTYDRAAVRLQGRDWACAMVAGDTSTHAGSTPGSFVPAAAAATPPASLGLMVFPDQQLETRYTAYRGWHLRTMLPRVSLFFGLSWLAALVMLPKQLPWTWCWWICAARFVLAAAITIVHLSVWLFSSHWPPIVASELHKCCLFLLNLTVAMMYVLLQKAINEVPGGNHAAGLAVHGWWILFASFRLQTAVMLHAINHMVYMLCEVEVAMHYGSSTVLTWQNLGYYLLITVGTTGIPVMVTAMIELHSRQQFLAGCQQHVDYSKDRAWQAAVWANQHSLRLYHAAVPQRPASRSTVM